MGAFLLLESICSLLENEKKNKRVIVTTNGCFDLLHWGHFAYLKEAKDQGDILVVGINADSSVRQIKGPSRPLVEQDQRAKCIAGLACVDYVFIFSEPDPRNFLAKIQPDIHVKGGDYQGKLLEQETVENYGGNVYLASPIPGISTTKLILRIKNSREC